MLIHTRSLAHKVNDIWRSPGRFTKNPDIIALPSGRYLLIYSDVDAHWSLQDQVLTLLASDDQGATWFKHREIDRADLAQGDERLVTPRLSRLNDGRLVVIIDHDDDGHFHEDQPPGNWLYWSHDDGDSWTPAQTESGIGGFEPDRVINLPDGALGVTSHLMRGATQEFAQVLWTSDDGGRNWSERSTIAHDGYHRFCEGAIVVLDGGARLACVMRENHSGGIPSFVAFSEDNGHTWTEPRMLPFALHRPYAKLLRDGRVMVTGRHVNGGLGTYAWVGDLAREAGEYAIGGPRRKYSANLRERALAIQNLPEHECRYTLLPPESAFSTVDFEAEVRVEASAGHSGVAFMSISRLGQLLTIAPDYIAISRGRHDMRHRCRHDALPPRRLAPPSRLVAGQARWRNGYAQMRFSRSMARQRFSWRQPFAAHTIWPVRRQRPQLLAPRQTIPAGQPAVCPTSNGTVERHVWRLPGSVSARAHDSAARQSSRPSALARPRLFILAATRGWQHLPGRLH